MSAPTFRERRAQGRVVNAHSSNPTRGITESQRNGLVLLSPANGRVNRRILYVDTYAGSRLWDKIKSGDMPPHHLRGCLELVRNGYEVLLAEPLLDFYWNRRALPHDLRLLGAVREWLGPDGIVFCGHNVLYWLLQLKKAHAIKCRIVSNLWAREPLNLARAHSGIIGLTAAGAEQAEKLAPGVPVAPIGWGADLSVYPDYPYRPDTFFSCGIALRDFETLSRAAACCRHRLDVVVPGPIEGVEWSRNVTAIDSGKGWNFESKRLSYQDLLTKYYARSAASLIIVREDAAQYTACGFTEIVEVMAMARPVIMTRTGALPTEIDIEKANCGIWVRPGDARAIAEAIDYLGDNPDVAEAMGRRGRELAERYYNIERYAEDLHRFFEQL